MLSFDEEMGVAECNSFVVKSMQTQRDDAFIQNSMSQLDFPICTLSSLTWTIRRLFVALRQLQFTSW